MNIQNSIEAYVESFSDTQVIQCYRFYDEGIYGTPDIKEPDDQNEKVKLRRKAIQDYISYSILRGKCMERKAEFEICIQDNLPSKFIYLMQHDWYFLEPLLHTLEQRKRRLYIMIVK